MRRVAGALVALALAGGPGPAAAISGNEQVRLAGEGRFDELAERIERENPPVSRTTGDRHALCFAWARLKDYAKLDGCLDALARGVAAGDRRTRLFGLDDATPAIDLLRAEMHVDLGQYADAIIAAQRVLAWVDREKSDDRDVEVGALALLAIAASLGGDRSAAESAFARLEKVSVAWPRYHSYANAKAMAVARAGLALGRCDRTLAALAENRSAFAFQVFLDDLVTGAAFRGRSNWVWQQLPRTYLAARCTLDTGRRDEAKAGYDRLLAVPGIAANGEIHWLALADRARIAEEEGDATLAIRLLGQAVDVIEAQRATINTEAAKIGFVGRRQDVYDRLVRLLLARGDAAAALEYVERSKSRALVDLLATRLRAPEAVHVDPRAAAALTSFLAAERASLRQVPVGPGAATASDRRGELAAATDQLRGVSAALAGLVAVDRTSLAELRKLLAPDEAMVQFHLAGGEGTVFVATRDSVRAFAFDAAALDDAVRDFRKAMESRARDIDRPAGALYRRLLGEALAEVREPKLLVVPHGPLHYLSFAALHDGTGWLLDRYALRTVPTATVLRYLDGRPRPTGASMLVLGNPDLDRAELDLPNAQAEAETIALASTEAKLLLRKAASETAFAESAAGRRYVHVASHGIFDAARPLDSALLLAPDTKNDGRLTVAELYRVKLDADLVTLSACETGVGGVVTGDDVVGLTRGLLYAGAASVVASFWNVDDRATSLLMQTFYAELARTDKREALRRAQLETRKRFRHPFFWSAFHLVGADL